MNPNLAARWICGALLLLGGVAVAIRPVRSQPPPAGSGSGLRSVPSAAALPIRSRGVGSCSAAACHGSPGPLGGKGSEYSTWATLDKHAQAYAVLLRQRSQQIERKLRGRADVRAEHDSLCLSCHDHPDEVVNAARLGCEAGEGVGCESCHGPSDRWLAQHNTYVWKSLTDDQKEAWGMRPTRNLVVRARTCVPCHVGVPGREVNHDLIAAGHPRLNFELAAFLSTMPRHWNDETDRARYPDLEARTWLVGQATSAQAALRLLAARASSAADHADSADPPAWPEFSEYSCFACHHDLKGAPAAFSVRSQQALGTPPWGTWYFALLPDLRAHGTAGPRLEPASLNELRFLMAQASPPERLVAAKADAAARELEGWIQALHRRPVSGGETRSLLAHLARLKKVSGPSRWDHDAQVFLGLAALYQAQGDLAPTERIASLRPALERMRESLTLPPGFESPAAPGSQCFDEALDLLRARLE